MDQNAFADPLSGSDSDSDDIFSYNEREQLPMVVASKSGDVDALRRALAAGGDPETLDGEGWTPIMNACYVGDHSEMVSILLDAGADPNGSGLYNWTTNLHMAANMGRVECTALLLSAGASVHAVSKDEDCRSPAEDLSDCRCRRILALLLRAGSPIPRLSFGSVAEGRSTWLCNGETPYNAQNYQIICEYRSKVVAAGSWAAYERAHRTRLAKVLAPKFPQIPAEIVPTIVAFAFHTGWY